MFENVELLNETPGFGITNKQTKKKTQNKTEENNAWFHSDHKLMEGLSAHRVSAYVC